MLSLDSFTDIPRDLIEQFIYMGFYNDIVMKYFKVCIPILHNQLISTASKLFDNFNTSPGNK